MKNNLRILSYEQYEKTFNHLIRESGSKSFEDILKYITDRPIKITTKLNYFNALISLYNSDPTRFDSEKGFDKIKEERNKLAEELKLAKKEDNLTARQREILEKISIDDVNKGLETLRAKKYETIKNLEHFILLSLMLPNPLRNDLMDIRIVKKKKELKDANAIWLPAKKTGEGILRITEYKSSDVKGYKPIEKILDVVLTNDVKNLIKKTSLLKPRVYLFEDRLGNPYSSAGFTQKMNKLFKTLLGIPFSSCVLRKLFWTSQKPKIDELTESARMCGHSLNTAMDVYVKKD